MCVCVIFSGIDRFIGGPTDKAKFNYPYDVTLSRREHEGFGFILVSSSTKSGATIGSCQMLLTAALTLHIINDLLFPLSALTLLGKRKSISLSVLMANFPGEPSQFIGSKDDGNGGGKWSYKMC